MKSLSSLKRFSPSAPHYLFGAVLLVRLLSLARLSALPLLLPARGDMHFYDDWAQRILAGTLTDHAAFYGLPLYAYLLAFIYKVFGHSPFVPALVQTILDAGTAVLIYHLCRLALRAPAGQDHQRALFASHIGETFAMFAGIGWAFFVPAEAYSIVLMPTAWMIFVFWFVVWRIVRKESAPTKTECFWTGILVGFAAMGIATVLFLIPFVLAALFLKPARHGGRNSISSLIAAITLLLAGVTIGTSPCWIHNSVGAKDPVFLSAHSGINFWIGNNPEATGYPKFPPGLRAGQAAMLEDSISAAESAAGHSLKRGEVSRFWSAQAKGFISQHPGNWLALLFTKFRNFWSAFQYDDLSIITILREQSVIFPGLYFGLVAVLAITGMIVGGWRTSKARWIGFAILLQLVALLTVFVTERYRLPAVPGLLVLSALGLSYLWEACLRMNFVAIARYVAVLIIATAFVSWPQQNPSLWALDAYNAGWQALESNNLPLAEKKLAIARAYVPENVETNFAFGNLRLAGGDNRSATSFYHEALRIDPGHKGTLNNLGVIALNGGDFPAARSFFEKALVQDRGNAKTHFLLAKTAFSSGDLAAATDEINKAIAIAPAQPEFVQLRNDIAVRMSR